MKAMTLKAHWAAAIFTLGKDCENRTWVPPPSVRGHRIAIHAGAGDNLTGRTLACKRKRDRIYEQISAHYPPFELYWDGEFDGLHPDDCSEMIDQMAISAIVSTAVIAGWWRQNNGEQVFYNACLNGGVMTYQDGMPGFVQPSRWLMPDHYGWHFTDIRVIDPIPCKGKLGLWEVPADIARAINGSN